MHMVHLKGNMTYAYGVLLVCSKCVRCEMCSGDWHQELSADLLKKADATKLDVLTSQVEILSDAPWGESC